MKEKTMYIKALDKEMPYGTEEAEAVLIEELTRAANKAEFRTSPYYIAITELQDAFWRRSRLNKERHEDQSN